MTTYSADEQKANRKLWVEALRSGAFQQAKGVLRDSRKDGFCCLGVACQVSQLGKWTADNHYVAGGYSNYAILPSPVLDWLGLADTAGEYDAASLTGKNDDGATFAEIASIIESEPPGLIAAVPDPTTP